MPFVQALSSPYVMGPWTCSWRSEPIRGSDAGGDALLIEQDREDGTVLLLLIDVAGNGTGVVRFLQAFCNRCLGDPLSKDLDPDELFVFLDGLMSQGWLMGDDFGPFISALGVQIDLSRRTLTAVTSGSPSPLVSELGRAAREWSLPIGRYLGVPIPGTTWNCAVEKLGLSESLVVFSDGVPDTFPPGQPTRRVGAQLVIRQCERNDILSAESLIDGVFSQLESVAQSQWAQSDCTLLVIAGSSRPTSLFTDSYQYLTGILRRIRKIFKRALRREPYRRGFSS